MTHPIADPLVENVVVDPIARVVRLDTSPEGVAVVTIDRPAAHNALDELTVEGLTEAFETLRGAEGVRIVFLRGAGGTLSAGEDLADLRTGLDDWTEDDHRGVAEAEGRMFRTLTEIPAVTVALVEGLARDGGAGLAAACDLAVAAAGASFAFSEAKRGQGPGMSAPYLAAAVGPRMAKALFLTGRTIDAAYAERIGLVHEVVADAAAMDHAMDRLIDWVMTSAPDAVAEAKRMDWGAAGRPVEPAFAEHLARRVARDRVGEEGREGVSALLEHRKPRWMR